MPPIASRASKIAYVLPGSRSCEVVRGADARQPGADDQDVDVPGELCLGDLGLLGVRGLSVMGPSLDPRQAPPVAVGPRHGPAVEAEHERRDVVASGGAPAWP